jgi:hypothetical protein
MIELVQVIDNRVEVPLDLTDEELLELFKLAHKADVTFNDFVEDVLKQYLEQMEYDNILNQLDGSRKSELVQAAWPYPS